MMKIAFAGDICFRSRETFGEAEARGYLREVQPLLDAADFRVVNLETPIAEGCAPIVKSGPNLNGTPANLGFLTAGRFDMAILANNHIGDYGTQGVRQTLRRLDDMGVARFGAGETIEEAYRARVLEKDGLRVSLLAACENEFGLADADRPGAAGFDEERLSDAIERETQNSDFVVVVFHGGCEHNPLPTPRVRARYRAMVRAGANAVVGMHPHCPQGYEIYRGAPIAYSLGNFFFHHANTDDTRWFTGLVETLAFERGREPQIELTPYRFDRELTLLSPFTGEALAKMRAYIDSISRPIADAALLEAYHKGWSMIEGIPYSRMLKFEPDRVREAGYAGEGEFARMRNLYSCEAHNELMTRLMHVIEYGETGFADEMAKKLLEMEVLPV